MVFMGFGSFPGIRSLSKRELFQLHRKEKEKEKEKEGCSKRVKVRTRTERNTQTILLGHEINSINLTNILIVLYVVIFLKIKY